MLRLKRSVNALVDFLRGGGYIRHTSQEIPLSENKNQATRRKKIGARLPGLRLPKWASEAQTDTYKRLRAAIAAAGNEKTWLDAASELARYARDNFGMDAADGLWTALWNYNATLPGANGAVVTCPNCGNRDLGLMLVERVDIRHARLTRAVREESKPTQGVFQGFFKDVELKCLDSAAVTKGVIWPEGCHHQEIRVRCSVCDEAWEGLDTVEYDPGFDGSPEPTDAPPAPKSMLN